jgi:hypothetical protein
MRAGAFAAIRHRRARLALRMLLALALAITWVLAAWNVGATR